MARQREDNSNKNNNNSTNTPQQQMQSDTAETASGSLPDKSQQEQQPPQQQQQQQQEQKLSCGPFASAVSGRRHCCLRGCCYRGCCSPLCSCGLFVSLILLLILILVVGGRLERDAVDSAPDTDELYRSKEVCGASGQTHVSLLLARAAGDEVVNCGACGACSTSHDISVYSSTLETLTDKATRCALWSLLGEGGVRDCFAQQIQFTKPCEDCWVENVMCDQRNCKWTCLQMVLTGQRKNAGGDGKLNDCLECDEELCGPAFYRCARANRRTSGLVSDIGRKSVQNCNKTS
ncbi:unnamed protein product [Polarella glacialis]|uniref:Uncharacterized protein n=1 Tax=Polarella glacialis TaxID=89957 RepID=A0A813LMN6_POLGL|nr:unnamed protein product [Polarella glacialis]